MQKTIEVSSCYIRMALDYLSAYVRIYTIPHMSLF